MHKTEWSPGRVEVMNKNGKFFQNVNLFPTDCEADTEAPPEKNEFSGDTL